MIYTFTLYKNEFEDEKTNNESLHHDYWKIIAKTKPLSSRFDRERNRWYLSYCLMDSSMQSKTDLLLDSRCNSYPYRHAHSARCFCRTAILMCQHRLISINRSNDKKTLLACIVLNIENKVKVMCLIAYPPDVYAWQWCTYIYLFCFFPVLFRSFVRSLYCIIEMINQIRDGYGKISHDRIECRIDDCALNQW